MAEAYFRKAIREALGTLNPAVEAAVRRELAVPIDLGHKFKNLRRSNRLNVQVLNSLIARQRPA